MLAQMKRSLPFSRGLSLCAVLAAMSLVGCYRTHNLFDDAGPVDATSGPRLGAGTASCRPGATVTVACGSRGLGSCTGDPVLVVCDGARTEPRRCSEETSPLGVSDDDTGLCPGLSVTCPSSGTLSVRAHPFGSTIGEPDCRWATR